MKPRRLLLTAMLLIMAAVVYANDWKAYLSYHDATKNIVVGDRVYSLASGALYYYRAGETQVHVFSKATGLSDTDIRFIVYNKNLQNFLLVYTNNNIDVLGTNDSIVNIPEYKNSSLTDKTINSVNVAGKNAYLATSFGIVVVNMESCEYSNTYNLGRKVINAISFEGKIYAATDEGVFAGSQSENLLDKTNWRIIGYNIPGVFVEFGGELYAQIYNGLCSFSTANTAMEYIYGKALTYVNNDGDQLVMGNSDGVITMDESRTLKTYPKSGNTYQWVSCSGSQFWISDGGNGLLQAVASGDTLLTDTIGIVPDSPIRNYCYSLGFTRNNRLLVGGGSLNYTGKTYEGTVMAMQDGVWTNFSEDSISIKTGQPYRNITSVIEDPTDPTHHFASAACVGLYEFRNARFVHCYGSENSPLQTIIAGDPYFTRTAGLNYDSEGNLWMLQSQVDTIIRILKPNGAWRSISTPAVSGYPTFDKLVFDSRGWVWITHRRTTAVHHAGVLCVSYGGTVDQTADDTYQFHYDFTNQDGQGYTLNEVYDVAEDRNGAIWIGTNQGPFYLPDPTVFFQTSLAFYQVKVPRNDGTSYADYLLTGVPITAIAIDGGNRKWFGTSDNGVYLVSADGLETLHHFTKENSPLLSNAIYAVAINQQTGEVFFGTDAGLISYRSDATEPAETLQSSNLKVYPNPVRPGFEGNVTVTGFSYNSDVKVVTTAGQLVYQGASVGGTFTWNCRNKVGKRVGSGVYYIIGADEQGKKGATAKVLIIK